MFTTGSSCEINVQCKGRILDIRQSVPLDYKGDERKRSYSKGGQNFRYCISRESIPLPDGKRHLVQQQWQVSCIIKNQSNPRTKQDTWLERAHQLCVRLQLLEVLEGHPGQSECLHQHREQQGQVLSTSDREFVIGVVVYHLWYGIKGRAVLPQHILTVFTPGELHVHETLTTSVNEKI